MTTRILGGKGGGGFTAGPGPSRPAPPAPKKGSSLGWVLGLIVVLAITFAVLKKNGTLERFFPTGTPAADQETK